MIMLFLFAISKENAVLMILCRNSDKDDMVETMKNFEEVFNSEFKYPYVFLNDEEFTDEFKNAIKNINKNVEFGKLSEEEWNVPNWIDAKKMEDGIKKLTDHHIIYGESLSYRKMCRFFSGFFYRNPLMKKYEYYWRIEPGVKFLCPIKYDVFEFMKTHKKDYGFVITMREYMETIKTLWPETMNFLEKNRHLIKNDTHFDYILNGNDYNGCHFWDNFEIANLNFFRSEIYQKFFDFLDKTGGFFYERWGDAPVHSIAVNLFLPKDKIHFFEDIGYEHHPYYHCPNIPSLAMNCKCIPELSIYNSQFSCTKEFRAEL